MHLQCTFSNLHDLGSVWHANNFDVIARIVNCLSTNMVDDEYWLVGYTCFRTDLSQRRGGGVIIYIKSHVYPES